MLSIQVLKPRQSWSHIQLQLQLDTARPRTRGLCAGTGAWRGLLVGKRVQEVREKKGKKGIIIIVGKMIIYIES